MTKDISDTIKLFDSCFDTAHQRMLESLKEDTKMQLFYILKLLDYKKDTIRELFTSSGQIAAGNQ
jgi:hypothetical protein